MMKYIVQLSFSWECEKRLRNTLRNSLKNVIVSFNKEPCAITKIYTNE